MRRSFASLVFAAFAFATPLMMSATAHASSLSSCGDIELAATAKCELKTSGGCTAECTPVNFDFACQAQCSGGCTVTVPTCNVDCEAGCTGGCTASPGSFDCEGDCSGKCEGNCSSYCAANPGTANCMASCTGSCSGECHAQCSATPPMASCDVACKASCTGSCNVQANVACDVSCEGSCSASLTGGCNLQCMAPKGALFCDGHYVDVGDSLDNCVNQILDELQIKVTGYAYADSSGSCANGTCNAQADAGAGGTVSCAASPLGPTGLGGYAIAGALAAIGAVVARRRKNKKAA